MALQGAFFGGVSGMNAQSKKIASISDNIINGNTVGYKGNDSQFATLVTDSGSKNSYSAGGVDTVNRRNVELQGMIQSTGNVSDIAVNGKGMLVVNSNSDASGDFLFTRAGSFRQDALGNFVNSAGYTLMAWPVDNEGRIPGEPGNLNTTSSALFDSLQSVNLRALGGAVSATTKISFSVNLDSGEAVMEGAGQTVSIPAASTTNSAIGLNDLIVPNSNVIEGANLVVRTPTQTFTYTYGGVSYTNDVSVGIMGATTLNGVFNTSIATGDKFTAYNPTLGTLSFLYKPTSPDPTKGEYNSLSTLAAAFNAATGVVARANGSRLFVSANDSNLALTFTDVTGTAASSLGLFDIAASTNGISNGGASTSDNIVTGGPLLGVSTAAAVFTAPTNGDTFTITTPSLGLRTFTFNNPIGGATQFNSLNTLATAINTITGLSANVANNRLTIQSDTSTDTLTFGFTGTDFATGLGLADTISVSGTVKRFSTLAGLKSLINEESSLRAKSSSAGSSNATLKIYNLDPLSTINYDYTYPLPGSQNLLTEFGLTRNYSNLTTNSDFARGTPSILSTGPAYDPLAVSASNMAAGGVTPHFSRNFEVYDPLGARHDFRLSVTKLGINIWAAEVYALTPAEIISSSGRSDGLVTYGTINFNGDGTPSSVSPALTSTVNVRWANGASDSAFNLFLGTAGDPLGTIGSSNIAKKDGLSQIRSDYNVQFVDQNGVSAALLSSVEIDDKGYVIANYRNGLSQKLFKIPLADFPNPNGLAALDGNVFSANQQAGAFNLREATKGGVGLIKAGALEQSNIELADELTKLIIAQRSYEGDTQILSTVNDLLKQLSRIFG